MHVLKHYFQFKYFIYTRTRIYDNFAFLVLLEANAERTFSKSTSLLLSFSIENTAMFENFSGFSYDLR